MHQYVIGKSGTGKSTLLETMAMQDLKWLKGFGLVDPPRRSLCPCIASQAVVQRGGDVIYPMYPVRSKPSRTTRSSGFPRTSEPLAASGLLEVFKRTWSDAWGVRMEHVMRNAILALIEQRNATLPDLLRILTDDAFRKAVGKRVSNEKVRWYWLKDYPNSRTHPSGHHCRYSEQA